MSRTSSATRRSGSRPSAGTRSRRTRGPWPTSARCCARPWRTGRSGCRPGLDYPPGAYATTGELAELMAEAARLGGFYHTHVRYPLGDGFLDPFREAIEIGRRGGAPVHITHFYHRATFPGPPERHARPRRRRAGQGPRRHLRPVPLRVVEHAPADHAADVDPGGRRRAPEVATRRPFRARADPRRDAGPRTPVRGGPLVGRASARRVQAARAPRLGGQDAGRRHARDRARRGRRDLRPPARRGPGGEPGDARATSRWHPGVPAPSAGRWSGPTAC